MRPFGFGWPNIVSVFRLLLVPVLLLLLLARGRASHYAAAGVFVLGAATDLLDGYLARRHHMTTRTGQWLDPLSDKALVIAPMLLLSFRGHFPWWGAALIIGREAAISVLRLYVGRRGAAMPASPLAKAKTVSQILAMTLYLIPGIPIDARLGSLFVALALTLYSGAQYFVRAPGLARSAG